jgi:hypothetical protein
LPKALESIDATTVDLKWIRWVVDSVRQRRFSNCRIALADSFAKNLKLAPGRRVAPHNEAMLEEFQRCESEPRRRGLSKANCIKEVAHEGAIG